MGVPAANTSGMDTSNSANLKAATEAKNSEIADCKGRLAGLGLHFARHPGDMEVRGVIRTARIELDRLLSELAELHNARTKIELAEEAERHKERVRQAQQRGRSLHEECLSRRNAAVKMQKAADAFVASIDEWRSLSDPLGSRVHEVFLDLHDYDTARTIIAAVGGAASGRGRFMAEALARVFVRATQALGSSFSTEFGWALDPFVQPKMSFTEAFDHEHQGLRVRLLEAPTKGQRIETWNEPQTDANLVAFPMQPSTH